MIDLRFLPDYPPTSRIYESDIEVVGMTFREKEARRFIKASQHGIALKPEPNNATDPNAIAVLGVYPGGLLGRKMKTAHAGYLPREVAEQVHRAELVDQVCARLKSVWAGQKGMAIRIDLVGPSDHKQKYLSS